MQVDLAECDPATVKMDGCNDVMNESRQLVSLNVLECPSMPQNAFRTRSS